MLGILLVTHGNFASGIVGASELIAGKSQKVGAIGLFQGDTVEEFSKKIEDKINEFNIEEGVLILTDFFGGTPSNQVMKFVLKKNITAVCGVNLGMLLEALAQRDNMALEQLANHLIKVGRTSIMNLEKKLLEIIND